ncbi:MAG: HAD family phosphatase [Clostridiales bacterium]|nr:HAD family phosphatase [Clostridiales bacterium]
MFNDITGAIFDLDGTLVNSMWVWEKIDKNYFDYLGIPIPSNLKDEINHLSFEQTASYFKNRFNIQASIEEIINKWNDMALYEYSNNVLLKDGAFDFIKKLKNNNIKIGLATSNSNILLEAALKNNNIYHYFDSITTSSEVKKSKDNPDIYLLAAKKLGVSPNNCIVFEDIIQGVKGAKLAGMKVVAVYDNYSKHQENDLIKIADKYIKSYTELM